MLVASPPKGARPGEFIAEIHELIRQPDVKIRLLLFSHERRTREAVGVFAQAKAAPADTKSHRASLDSGQLRQGAGPVPGALSKRGWPAAAASAE